LKPEYHITISLVLSIIFYLFTKSAFGSVSVFLAGVSIDLDHIIDFWISNKKFLFNIKEFFDYFYDNDYTKGYILLHSVEFIPIIFVLGNMFLGKIITYGILLGFISHIIADYIGNGCKPLTYFLTYRTYRKFDVSCFCRCKECLK